MSKVISCYWNIHINGKLLDIYRKKYIESVEIEELCDGSDICTIVLNDPDFVFIEDNIFVEEATVSVSIGWHGDSHRVTFDGYISAIDINFPESGYPIMSIFCMDNSHVMNRKKNTRSWDNVTRAEVVQKIAMEYGFKCVIEPGYTFKAESSISQSDATDIEFCESLAGEEREPFMCKLIGDTLYYVKKGIIKNAVAELQYRKVPYDVVSFKPQINKETKKEEVESADINISDKTVDSAVSNNENTIRDTLGEPVMTTSNQMVYDPMTGKWSSNVSTPIMGSRPTREQLIK